ncbi:hypothetical protein [Streptomyces sp. NPDC005336]|uniref:hypothetical protein n=1 Tax=Streptomyces sp. NPDC005336 TaxID=3157035 RepID=UPI0033A22A21
MRGRHTLVARRTSCRNQAHAVLAKQVIAAPMSDLPFAWVVTACIRTCPVQGGDFSGRPGITPE